MSVKGKNIRKGKYIPKVKLNNPIRTKTPLKSVSKAKTNAQKLEKQFNQRLRAPLNEKKTRYMHP